MYARKGILVVGFVLLTIIVVGVTWSLVDQGDRSQPSPGVAMQTGETTVTESPTDRIEPLAGANGQSSANQAQQIATSQLGAFNQKPLGVTEIRQAQELLASLGFNPGPADGVDGPKTRSAVQAFQKDNGIFPDGKINATLISRLKAAAS